MVSSQITSQQAPSGENRETGKQHDPDRAGFPKAGSSQSSPQMKLSLLEIQPFSSHQRPAPEVLTLPMHTKVRLAVSSNFNVLEFRWSGAERMEQTDRSSVAEQSFQKPGLYPILVTPVARLVNGTVVTMKEEAKSIVVHVTRVPAERMSIRMTDPTPDVVVKSAGKALTCHAATVPPGYEDVIEWTGGGDPELGWGATFSTAYSNKGRYTLQAGRDASQYIDVYEIASIRRDSRYGDLIWNGFPITFTARTDPMGYENYVTWTVDTMGNMHTKAEPSYWVGGAFTTTFSPMDKSGTLWAQVYADNVPSLQSADVACPTPGIYFQTPRSGDTLSTDELGTIIATLAPPYDDPSQVANVEVFATKPGFPTIPIDSGDLRSPMGIPRDRVAFWDLTGIASGDYTLTVRVTPTNCQLLGSASVVVHVNQPPIVSDIQAMNCVSVPSACGGNGFCTQFPATPCTTSADCVGRQITLSAIAADADGESITEYIWDPGLNQNPVLQTSSTLTLTYPPGSLIAIVGATAHDAGGGDTTAIRDVDLVACSTHGTQDCGCSQMEVFSTIGMTFVYCAPENAIIPEDIGCMLEVAPPPGEACPPKSKAFRCPVGPILPGNDRKIFGWGFEVNVILTEDTNKINCEEGQFAQISVTKNGQAQSALASDKRKPPAPLGGILNLPDGPARPGGVNFSIVPNGAPIPAFNAVNGGAPQLGADGHGEPSLFKRHLPNIRRIQWYDQPALEPFAPTDTGEYKARFLTFVSGNKGTCWCYFELNHSWANGSRTGLPGVLKLDGERCSIP
jgi:hypothetical protein